MRFFLEALSQPETALYVKHRMEVAGGSIELFTPDALALIHERSGGIPRRINQLCDSTLLTGYGKNVKTIDSDLIQETIKSLSL
jgi:general secretion pathway protein A